MPTLAEGRLALARQPGLGLTRFWSGVCQPDGTYLGVATGPDARRTIVSSDLVRLAVAGSSDTESRSDYHDAQWVYWPDEAVQRNLANQGYSAATQAGSVTDLGGNTDPVATLKAVRTFPSLIPPATPLELHAACPVLDSDQMTGLHSHLRRAARAMRFRSRVELVSTGDRRLAVPYSWIASEGQLIGVYDREKTSGTDPLPLPGGAELRLDGEAAYLLFDYAPVVGTPFFADFWRPRSSWVRHLGTWGDSTAGPVEELDEVSVDLDQWVCVAYYFTCDSLSQSNPRGEISSWAKRRDRAAIRASPFMQWQAPAVSQRSRRSSSGAGRGYGRGRLAVRGWP